MEKTISTPSPVIAKMAQLMMAIETRISKEGRVYLPKQRSRFIDMTALGLSDLEDDFFTYDQIKQLVVSMVQRHESACASWIIDLKNCTSEKIAIVVEPGHLTAQIPLNLFIATIAPSSTPATQH